MSTETAYELPPSLRERLLALLAVEPGWRTGHQLHVALVEDGWVGSLQRVYNELGSMARRGEVVRHRNPVHIENSPLTYYCLAPTQTSP